MKRKRYITCERGDTALTFGEDPSSPLFLLDADGLYSMEAEVTITNNTLSDGGTYQSSLIKPRAITLTVVSRGTDDHILTRNAFFTLFQEKMPGRLSVHDSDGDSIQTRVIDYYVESVSSDGLNSMRTYTISLKCPDPYFYNPEDEFVRMATWASAFSFTHAFTSAGEELGARLKAKSINIRNATGADATGLTVEIAVNGSATNPSITRVESGERIKLGTDLKTLTLQYGDLITITTGQNNKHTYLTRGGVKKEINQYLTSDSVFFTLHSGDNTIGYDADSGIDSLSVTVDYRMRYTHA